MCVSWDWVPVILLFAVLFVALHFGGVRSHERRGKAFFKAVQPIWYFYAKGVFDFCLVEYRISGTLYGSRKLGTVTWHDVAIFMS